jgi:hypothetical protein
LPDFTDKRKRKAPKTRDEEYEDLKNRLNLFKQNGFCNICCKCFSEKKKMNAHKKICSEKLEKFNFHQEYEEENSSSDNNRNSFNLGNQTNKSKNSSKNFDFLFV